MAQKSTRNPKIPRREFLKTSGISVGAVGAITSESSLLARQQTEQGRVRDSARRPYNVDYSGEYLNRVAFPLGE